jgi:hypothetical protein
VGAEILEEPVAERLRQVLQRGEDVLSMVRRHVRLGEIFVARQREIVEDFHRRARDTTRAEELLRTMKALLQTAPGTQGRSRGRPFSLRRNMRQGP